MTILSLTRRASAPSPGLSLVPVLLLIVSLVLVIALYGADQVQSLSPWVLLSSAGMALALTLTFTRRPLRLIGMGLAKSARQILPAVPVLLLIAVLSTTWMLSGVVPLLISYGVSLIDPNWFLVTTCAVCAAVSVLTGSSWTTIATIGVAFMGVGSVMDYNICWTAGAVISGAYFGDKVSPLSDTTVLAATSCGLDLMHHIRFLMYTSIPAMCMALAVYALMGMITPHASAGQQLAMSEAIASSFHLTGWLLLVPALTIILTLLRVPTVWVLAAGATAGMGAMLMWQPDMVGAIAQGRPLPLVLGQIALTGATPATGSPLLEQLVDTAGIAGMMPTVYLVLCAMIFGGVMIGTGMLGALTRTFTRMLRRPRALVGATVCSGLFLNSCTGDQYLSIIIGGNIYRSTYRRRGLANEMLSRSLEDSISVTSVLIPWNSCGVTQAGVLGVATVAYLPFCVFNWMSPILSVLFAWVGFKVRHLPGSTTDPTITAPQALSLNSTGKVLQQ